MLYIFAKTETAIDAASVSLNAEGRLCLNDVPVTSTPEYLNYGKQVTVYNLGHKEFILGKGVSYEINNLLMPYRSKPQTPSFFNGLEDLMKPDAFRLKYALVGQDVLMFFPAYNEMELFLHDRLFASQFFFNDKNDRFRCSIFQTRSEIFLSKGLNTIVLDVFAYSYSKVLCEGATLEPFVDEGKHIVTQTLYTDAAKGVRPIDLISTDTDSYRITFPVKGTYYINVMNDNFYPMETFTRVIVC